MSSFKGNALRGTFFLVFGLGWSVKYPLKYLSRTLNADSQASRWIQKLDILEGAAKAFLAVAGMLAEQFVPDGPHMGLYSGETYSWEKLTNWQYTTMYLFYGLSGIVDVLSYSPLKLSLGLDRLLLSVAMFTEVLITRIQQGNETVPRPFVFDGATSQLGHVMRTTKAAIAMVYVHYVTAKEGNQTLL
ncbi:enoyl-CoA hydratase [Platysternon megacephalum]|uniref:Enoyl-CoA hydratase n=1 Tax=Platysternon megacephalum TaxID=55544 RepID=A0A4D9DG22_9SAUR|nr:enoyl-CoA hydratase [Platysternon megacephalum]